MTVTAAAVHLPRFARSGVAEVVGVGFRPLNEKPTPAAPAEDRLAAQNVAVAEALAAARAEFDTARAADRAVFEQRLAERETEILATIGAALGGQVSEGLTAIETRVGEAVSAALMHFLGHAIRERAVSELCEAVSALLAGGTATRVRIAGPSALTERVEAAIAPAGVPVERAEGDTADVSVTIDDTLMETNIAAWLDRLMAQAGPADNG